MPVVMEINLSLGPSDLLIVVGKIGSGKTSLLHALMDETIKVKGTSEVRGKIAYVEQEPFIISASIKQNVAFGLKYDDAKFERAFKASHLESDIQNFSNGADTVIGERGINISGGQKARISLARAIY
jgi:ABC-type multidrug transport system fused ATPase/permease subunit